MNKQTVTWRQSYEPFKGRVWEFGLYRVQEYGRNEYNQNIYAAFHGDIKIYTSADLYTAQLHCEKRMS